MIPSWGPGGDRGKNAATPTILVSGRRRCGISKNAILSDSTGCRHPRAHSWRQPSATPHAASFVLNKPDDGAISLCLALDLSLFFFRSRSRALFLTLSFVRLIERWEEVRRVFENVIKRWLNDIIKCLIL